MRAIPEWAAVSVFCHRSHDPTVGFTPTLPGPGLRLVEFAAWPRAGGRPSLLINGA